MIGFVIPIKKLDCVKTRLEKELCLKEREDLCIHMARNMINAAANCSDISRIYVVSPQKDLCRYLHADMPVSYICSSQDTGLNQAARIAGARLMADGMDTMIFLHGDLPFITIGNLELLCRKALEYQVVLVADMKGEGTNGVVLTPPDVVETAFGADSLEKHMKICSQNRLAPYLVKEYGISQDIDQPCDLAALMH